MLTPTRHEIILEQLERYQTVKIQDLVHETGASESTIRRDLSQLENANKLKRVHGGASCLNQASEELSIREKAAQNLDEKVAIAQEAASLIRDGDCIFLDAGTTTYQMIPFLKGRKLTVVTNGVTLLEELTENQVLTYLTGGFVKHKTRALIGRGATHSLQQYRFDKCFLGVNGVHPSHGYTTPDPEEALVKQTVLTLSQERFVLGDASKLNELSFASIASLQEATLITDEKDPERLSPYQAKTNVKVVSS
ncbi:MULTISPECIES: DeoR/GlpR family DNA-binding transcription regulator [Pontibacillus]|uniref:DeoR/GlpR family DNA-binding transcription regulator n=1 Tax=Pontibacillus chungwhensis TaxID=265426 RepID=A0ABY8UVK2_9BACI|nr:MULTISPECIES: DeoR/GlpR family DNA-binding transcription regulator [Pontibacillus]MCD5325259.1 DeoR/GlpR family DNA-binding transcription regulator [Pontibacillus sp. HN14]WIF97504.1 DeoR/GlpR family DNA-binding transcription regulator [Pontibacillus chungwhensis]